MMPLVPTSAGRPRAFPRHLAGVAGAIAISIVSIWGASAFTREAPPPPPVARGVTVTENAVSLAADAPQWKVLHVAPAKPSSGHFSDPVPARVKIDETRAARVGSPLGGRVTQVFVELGQTVKLGDPLFSVASPDIAGLRVEREKSQVDYEITKERLARMQAMVALHAAAQKDELDANQQYRQASLALKLAQSKLASLKVSSRAENEFSVVAPRDGVIVEKNVLSAQQIGGGDAGLVSIADLVSVWVVAELFEADSAGITRGTLAQVTSPAIPDFAVETKVEMVSAVVDPVRHTVPVRVRIDNPDGRLKPNIFAQMRFSVAPREGCVEVPVSALLTDGEKQFVYVQTSPGRFTRRDVVAGSTRAAVVPVLEGLKAGEIVVEQGAILLDNHIALYR